MSIIVKSGEHHILDPANIHYGSLTILQQTFLRLLPNSTPEHFSILRANPGEEIDLFQGLMTRTPPIVLRDDRGISVIADSPTDDVVLAIIRSLAISFEEASRRAPNLRNAILAVDSPVYYIQSTGTSLSSFLYDGHKKEGTGRFVKVKESKDILSKAIERAKEAIVSEETIGLKVLTPAEAQDDILQLLSRNLRMTVVKRGDDWDMDLTSPVSLSKLYPYVFLVNRGFIRATHPGMLLPDNAPNQIIRQIESIGKRIGLRRSGDTFLNEVSSVEMREYVANEEFVVGDSSIQPISGANPFEMRSAYKFNRFRPVLMPVL